MSGRTYAYAVVPTQGMYGSGDVVRIAGSSNSLPVARDLARRLTRKYQDDMRPYGGSNGGYRVIAWDRPDRTIDGVFLDRAKTVRD